MIRRPPRSTLDRSSAASDVYKRQREADQERDRVGIDGDAEAVDAEAETGVAQRGEGLSLIHISEPTRPY